LVAAVALCLVTIAGGAHSEAAADPYATVGVDLDPGDTAAVTAHLVAGTDDRQRVSATSTTPWSMVTLLLVEWPSGDVTTCSGFVVSRRTVGTAGHCLFSPERGGYASRVLAIPGADGAVAPFGTHWATNIRTVRGYAETEDLRYDVGAVFFGGDLPASIGAFTTAVQDDTTLLGQSVSVAGYPGSKEPATLWTMSGGFDSADPAFLYSARIDASEGNSGGPAFTRLPSGRYAVVGVLSHEREGETNVFVRMHEQAHERFTAWQVGPDAEAGANPTPAPPAVTAGDRTIVASPARIAAPLGTAAYVVLAVGAVEGAGDLVMSTSGGVLVANTLLTPGSCADGSTACVSVVGNGTRDLAIPDAGNDLDAVLLTLSGRVANPTTVTVTATQGVDTWSTEIAVVPSESVAPTPPPGAGSGTVTGGAIPPSGFGLFVFGGGTNEQLVAASGCPLTTAVFWVADGGKFITYVPGSAIAVVNAPWNERFASGIPPATAMIGRCS
jgi:V8-like Glu-specific endopeptidase